MYETRKGVRMCTNTAADPVVSGDNRSLGIFYCVHKFFECGIEGRILFWSVDDDAALKYCVSRVRRNSIQCDRAHPDTADLWTGLEHEGSNNSLCPW